MFKCKECGAEYNIKPDYCECGNDIFELIDDEIEDIKEIEENEILEIPKIDFISPIIFAVCIILSVVVLFFVGNPKKADKIPQDVTVEEITDIPDIDTFWDNTPKKLQKITVKEEPKTEPMKILQEITEKIIPQPVQKTTALKPIAVKVQTKSRPSKTVQVQTKTSAKTTVTRKTQPIGQKTVDNNISNLTKRVQKNAQNSLNKQTQASTSQLKLVQQQTQPAQNVVTAQKQPAQVQTPQTTFQQVAKPQVQKATVQEFANYKISLRNTIGRKIDFTKVVGDGSCSLSFKVNSNGKLTNRTFTQQSSNITLNDVVYSAMLATPNFNSPPSGYSDQTYRLTVKFYNGNFDITLH
ncbi:hypothetical protein J6G99_08195 [bacterium]|nr:hypothetical protein [bacterium]